MTPERWQQIEEIFQTVIECAPAERPVALAQYCGGDDELRREIESLLDHQVPDAFIHAPIRGAAQALAEKADEALPGRRLGAYQLTRLLGRGGMGMVYQAHDTRLERSVALKLLHARFTQDPERVRRFQREARAASALNHPNILTIYEVGQVEEAHFIATELVTGETLRTRLSDDGLQLGEALDLALQVASALAAAHEAGIIHRDIKPENLMVRPDGLVKVLDFGLAKLNRETDDEFATATSLSGGETRAGIIFGTVNYMSPEQARGEKVDARSDIFSLGTVLYEMLTGERPFTGPTASHVLVAILENEPPPLERYLPGLPAELQQIVTRALAKPLAQRYQTAREFGEALKQLKEELEFAAKLQRPSANDGAVLTLKVGATMAATSHPTPATGLSALQTKVINYLRRRGRAIGLAVTAASLLIAGILLGGRWLSARDVRLDSVAVLPFVNVGNDSQMEYLPDGLTESLISSLSQLPSLRVMARNTVFTYKGREVDPRQVGADLKVRAVVTGRVRRQGERLLIRAELVDATSGAQLWGDEYERPLADLLTMERDLTREISAALRPRLSGAEQQQIAKRQSANSEAYRLYMLGRHLYLQSVIANNEQALAYFNQAIALDPNYALAYTGVADVYSTISAQLLLPAEAMPKAHQAALTAIKLDEMLPEAHQSLGTVKLWGDWDWAGAEREFKRAIELNPSFVLAHVAYANLVASQGRFEEAMAEARRAQELDPLSLQANSALGRISYHARRYAEALVYFQKIGEIDPNNSGAHLNVGLTLSQQGKHQAAISELRRGYELNQQQTYPAWLAYGYARAGHRNEALKLLRELESLSTHERVPPIYIARIYCGLGNNEQALTWLRKAYDERSDNMLTIGVDPAYDPLRADPRFIEMLRGLGLAK